MPETPKDAFSASFSNERDATARFLALQAMIWNLLNQSSF